MFCMQGLCAHRALRCAAASGAAMCAPRHYVYRISPARRAGIFGVAARIWCGCAGRVSRRVGGCMTAAVWKKDHIGPYYGISCPECGKSCSRQAVSKSVNIKNRSNLGICCLGNCVRCGFHNFIENGFAGGITAGREAACGRNHRSIFGVQRACRIEYRMWLWRRDQAVLRLVIARLQPNHKNRKHEKRGSNPYPAPLRGAPMPHDGDPRRARPLPQQRCHPWRILGGRAFRLAELTAGI